MNVMKSLWASVQGNPVFMRRVNGWLTVFCDRHDPRIACHALGQQCRLRVRALPLGARLGSLESWQAARVEVKQDAAIETAADDSLAA